MSEWKEIITTRKSSLAVGLAWSICSIHHIQQGIEKSQQAVGEISSQTLLHSEKPIAKQAVSQFETKIGQQAVAQLVQIPWIQIITKNLPYDFGSSLPGIEEIEAELRDFLLCSGLKNHRDHREKRQSSVFSECWYENKINNELARTKYELTLPEFVSVRLGSLFFSCSFVNQRFIADSAVDYLCKILQFPRECDNNPIEQG